MMQSGELLKVLNDVSADTLSLQSIRKVEKNLARHFQTLGFESFNLSVNKATAEEFISAPTFTSWSREDLSAYSDNGWQNRDPLLKYVKSQSNPLLWTVEDWRVWGYDEYHEYLVSSGIHGGLSIPMHLGGKGLSAMTLLTTRGTSMSNEHIQTVRTIGHMMAAHAVSIGAAQRGNDWALKLKNLSGRQLEILRWISFGKSNSEISIILGLSKRGIDYHVSEIIRKLNVTNRAQAAAIYMAS